METRSLDANEGLRVWIRAWNFSKPQWGQLVLVALVSFTLPFLAALIPVIGFAVAATLLGLMMFGFICIGNEIRWRGSFQFKTLLAGFEKKTVKLLWPLIRIWATFGLLEGVVHFLIFGDLSMRFEVFLTMVLVSLSVIALLVFAAPLIVYKNQPIGKAIESSLEAVLKNLGALAFYIFVPAATMILTLLPLYLGVVRGVPMETPVLIIMAACVSMCALFMVFFVGLPSFVVSFYLLYEKIFN